MKYQSRVSIVLALSLFISMLSFPLKAQGQTRPRRFRGDTGVITLGLGQVLRITVNGGDGNDTFRVRFAWMKYMPAGCNTEGVCRHTIQSHGATDPVNIGAGEAASFDVQGISSAGTVRVENFADGNLDGVVNADAMIINSATGEVVSHVILANTEGDFH